MLLRLLRVPVRRFLRINQSNARQSMGERELPSRDRCGQAAKQNAQAKLHPHTSVPKQSSFCEIAVHDLALLGADSFVLDAGAASTV
jgi:hypothetical protein